MILELNHVPHSWPIFPPLIFTTPQWGSWRLGIPTSQLRNPEAQRTDVQGHEVRLKWQSQQLTPDLNQHCVRSKEGPPGTETEVTSGGVAEQTSWLKCAGLHMP